MILILVFLVGFLTNAIVWRLQEHRYDDLQFPVILLVLNILMVALRWRQIAKDYRGK